MEEIIKKVVGGGIALLVIGGVGFTISQADVVNNLAEETGMTQEQAQQYVDESQGQLESFAKIGQDTIDSGNEAIRVANSIDCVSYEYEWESASLSCNEGKGQLSRLGNSEVALGECYKTLDTDLGKAARSRIEECIAAIDAVMSSHGAPIVQFMISDEDLAESKKANAYNKSVLRAALQSDAKN